MNRLSFPALLSQRIDEALYADGEFDIFSEADTLTAGDLLPGFAVLVKNLFEE